MSRNSTTHVNYDELTSQIASLADLRTQSTSQIKSKYNEVKSVFVNSDSKAAEQFYATADELYSVDEILNSMINQTIRTFQYAKELFSDIETDFCDTIGG